MEIESTKEKNKYEPLQTEEEEVKIDAEKLKAVKLIQSKYREHLQYKRVRALAQEAEYLQKNPVKPQDPTEDNVREVSLKQSFYIKKLPTEAWINIFSFVADYQQLLGISRTCKLFNQICKMNILWLESLRVSMPKVYQKYDFKVTNVKDINWRDVVKEKCLVIKAYAKIIKSMHEQKDRGNAFFHQAKYSEAASCFKDALDFMKNSKKNLVDVNDVITKELQSEGLKITAILLSNSSMVEIKLENWPKAFYDAVKAKKKLKMIRDLMDDPEEYKKKFELLEEKVIYRMKQAWVNFPMISFVRYSDQVVEGVGVGTMIEATENISGGIFSGSKVLMVDYDRSHSIKGVIINKTVNVQGSRMRVGGPCEMHVKTTLHNIPNVPGAKQVLEGVWVGGEVDSYRGNPQYKINDYYGYAAWFDGQLDGELRHNDWSWHNNAAADQIFTDY